MMAYEGNKVIERLDRLAAATIDANAENGAAPRLSILANLVFMAAGSAGLVLTAQGDTGPGLVFGALIMSTTHSGIVEYQKRGKAPLDEREWGVFWKAMAIGAFVPCVLVGLWMMLLGPLADQGMWYPDRPEEWQAAGLFILGLTVQISNIAKAWMTPSYAAELLDDD
ncbi:MAG: hypothetical protein KAF27_08580 [Porphyrobacter sp.]|nr:hypothetical protein [Porphyrobacter sp.]